MAGCGMSPGKKGGGVRLLKFSGRLEARLEFKG